MCRPAAPEGRGDSDDEGLRASERVGQGDVGEAALQPGAQDGGGEGVPDAEGDEGQDTVGRREHAAGWELGHQVRGWGWGWLEFEGVIKCVS